MPLTPPPDDGSYIDPFGTREIEKIKRVARAIRNAIVIECHTHHTYDLDYEAAAKAAILEAARG